MHPITIRLDEDEVEELDGEAEQRGFSSRADYLRWIIRNRPSVEKTTAETLDERLEVVESRIKQLESELDR